MKWKWWVTPSEEKNWGLPVALPETAKTASGTLGGPPPPNPDSYEVKKGDALILIARKFHMRVDQLKLFNGLASDMIRDRSLAKKLDDDPDYFRKNYTVTEDELTVMREKNMIRLYELGLHPFLLVCFAGMKIGRAHV